MMKSRLLACLPALLGFASAHAGDAAGTPTRLPQFFVSGDRVGSLEVSVPRGDLNRAEPNLGRELLAIPGVFGHARAADAMEPSIRGLGLDRVTTSLNGIPLANASPERTNSPVVIVGPAAVTSITVTKSLPSVTLGPVTTGGHIELGTADASPEGAASFLLRTTYDGGRDGTMTQARVGLRSGAVSAAATGFFTRLGDYTSADGRVVAAKLEEQGGSASLGWTTASHRLQADVLHRRLRLQETISLPLDGRNTDTEVFTLHDRWTPPGTGPLKSLEWRSGYAFTDPYITSELRTLPAATSAEATSRSFGASAGSVWQFGESNRIAVGADHGRQQRRAVRTTPAGRDFIWPDAVYEDTGLFAEWTRPLPAKWSVRLGARLDRVTSDARDVDQPALGRPIREQFITFNGPSAAVIAKRERAGAANLLLEWKPSEPFSAFVGTGFSRQPAPITERYRAFLNALGGDGRGGNAVELGNPALRSERKSAVEIGGISRLTWVSLEATAYYYRVDDFILRKPVGFTAPPLPRMVVFGYRNAGAEFSGAELGATVKPAVAWSLPCTFAIARGHETATGRGLPEIPPWEATAAARYRHPAPKTPFAAEFGLRLVGARQNPAPLDNPLFTRAGGFSVWHVRAGLPLGAHVRLEAGVENLFDRRYSEYLSPPTGPFRPASGNLLPGERVPAAGRSGWVSVTLLW